MKMMKRTIYFVMIVSLLAFPVFAEEMSNYELTERLKQIEERLKTSVLPEGWAERVSFSGTIEVEAGYESIDPAEDGADSEESSDFSLATAELGIDANIVKHVSGHVLFSYEDDEDVIVDEATITISGEDILPAYLTAGKLYVPFGNFETHMISDPLTLELGEARETALCVGIEHQGFYGAIYAFNDEADVLTAQLAIEF